MIVAWVLFPLVLLAVCLGCGLAVERVAGWRLPGALLPSVGLALVIVTATLTTYQGETAPFTTAAVVALALAGYVSSRRRIGELRPEPWTLAVGVGVYAVFAAPVVLSSNATFLGYFVLNDTAVHLALIDQLLAHGRDLGGVPHSAFSTVVHSYLSTDYPIGSQVALGAVRPLVAQNVAWIFQPYLATILSLGAVALYELLDGVVGSHPLRALCAFVAAQSGLVYALYLEASIKEVATTWIITLTVVLVLATLRGALGPRRLVPLAVVAVAAFDVLNIAIAPWLGVPLGVFVMLAGRRARDTIRRASKRRLAVASIGFGAALSVIVAPIIASAQTSYDVVSAVLTQQGNLGNLVTPISRWQLLGIWPSGDFRFPVVTHAAIAYVLLGVALVSAALGASWAIWRRAAGPLLLLAGSGLAALYLLSRASPYASAKVMTIFSLTVTLFVMLGAVALRELAGRVLAWLLAAALAGGVLWTNALAYRAASVAPRARFAELASIGSRFSDRGPAFYNLSDEFAIHFLSPEAIADPAYGAPTRRPGLRPRIPQQVRAPWDLDELYEPYLQGFPLLVLGRSPRDSRPPADYRLAYRGRYYEVWRRAAIPHVLEHLALGTPLRPAAVPRCETVAALAARARREHARLLYAPRATMPVFVPTRARWPRGWGPVFHDRYSLIPRQPGAVSGRLHVHTAGRYELWLQGSFGLTVKVRIDGRDVASASHQLGPQGQAVALGELELSAGAHRVAIVVPSEKLAAGEWSVDQTIGPLMLAPSPGVEPLRQVDPNRARLLCGQSLDWIEVVR